MRHQHAGLAIWDFPLAHGQVWPATDAASVANYNEKRLALQGELHASKKLLDESGNPVTFLATGKEIQVWHVWMQMLHRVGAVATLALVVALVVKTRQQLGQAHRFTRASYVLLAMILGQAGMGIWTLLSNKAADVATGHVLLGAVCLAFTSLMLMVAKRCEFVAGEEIQLAKRDLSLMADADRAALLV